jgi:zeta-carotene desaturase
MVEPRDVVVIGGGFAGLSAAVALAKRGFRVAVLERKPALGGRAYSFADSETGDFVDNGQHVLMGCYAETLKFLDRIGQSGQLVFHRNLAIEMLERDGRAGVLKTARLPGPLHMTAALMRYGLLTPRERLSALVAGLRMLRMHRHDRARLALATVKALMDALGQGERARRCLWYPLAIATLNEDPELASAALLAEVLSAHFSRAAPTPPSCMRRSALAIAIAPARCG